MGKITIDKLDIVGTWGYDTENKNCPLCRVDLMAPTQEDIDNRNIKNNVVVGKCRHSYHKSCIDKWTNNGNISCTSCNVEWKPERTVSASVCMRKSANIPTGIVKPVEKTTMPGAADVLDNIEINDEEDQVYPPKKNAVKAKKVKKSAHVFLSDDEEISDDSD